MVDNGNSTGVKSYWKGGQIGRARTGCSVIIAGGLVVETLATLVVLGEMGVAAFGDTAAMATVLATNLTIHHDSVFCIIWNVLADR